MAMSNKSQHSAQFKCSTLLACALQHRGTSFCVALSLSARPCFGRLYLASAATTRPVRLLLAQHQPDEAPAVPPQHLVLDWGTYADQLGDHYAQSLVVVHRAFAHDQLDRCLRSLGGLRVRLHRAHRVTLAYDVSLAAC